AALCSAGISCCVLIVHFLIHTLETARPRLHVGEAHGLWQSGVAVSDERVLTHAQSNREEEDSAHAKESCDVDNAELECCQAVRVQDARFYNEEHIHIVHDKEQDRSATHSPRRTLHVAWHQEEQRNHEVEEDE